MKNKILNNYKNYLLIYLSLLFSLSVCFLYLKHDVGNDSTISEWLINYSGGFTKRGIIGQISIYIARIFNSELRDIILYFQVIIIGVYFTFIFVFLKKIYIERIYLMCIFTPIFLLYPVYEIEVLARKEIFIFILFLIHLSILIYKFKFANISKLLTFTLSVLIWEPIIFFLPMWILIDFASKDLNKKNNLYLLIKDLVFYLPGLIICMIFIFNPLSETEYFKMVTTLKDEFNEVCYMSCSLLMLKSSLIQQFTGNFHAYSIENILRYMWIMIIGFLPLFVLLNHSYLKKKKTSNFLINNEKKISSLFYFILSPVLILFLMGYDWGRWVNISYTLSLLTFLYLYKKEIIKINFKTLKKNKLNLLSLRNFSLIFIIYCFTWSPKTVITGDIGSFPLYRAIYKIYKTFLI
ncbi:hypothetical protein OA967_00785 [Candidatus Pelagibacter sp.]|nr:hypothetical protein [Candidatus Pelagibacter sp.]